MFEVPFDFDRYPDRIKQERSDLSQPPKNKRHDTEKEESGKECSPSFSASWSSL